MHLHAYVLQESAAKGRDMKKNMIRRSKLITKMKKQFLALMLGVILAIMPSTTVMAFDIIIDNGTISNSFKGLKLYPNTDKIVWTMNTTTTPGGLNVVYKDKDGEELESYGPVQIIPDEYRNRPFEYVIESRDSIADFHHWIIDSVELVDPNDDYNFAFARFILVPVLTTEGWSVNFTTEPEGAGHPTSEVSLVFSDDRSTLFDIKANPEEEYDFVRWEVLNDNASIDNTTAANTLFRYQTNGEVSIKAVYKRKADTDNSGSSSGDSVNPGDSVTNAADPLQNVPNGLSQTDNQAGGNTGELSDSTPTAQSAVSTPSVIVGGKVHKSTVSGAFITQNIAIAVVGPASELRTHAGLGAGESLYFKGWEFTAKQSPLAYQALDNAAVLTGANVLQCIELDFGKMTFGKFSELDESVIARTTISLPKKADKNKKHALARAAKGGKTQILENFSEDPNVITSDIPCGESAIGIIEYNK